VAEPVRARRLTEQEGRKLQQIVRRGKHESVRVRRALIIMASASGTTVPAIARLVQAHEDTVRDVIHSFNERGLAALDPRWAGGRPRQITSDDEQYIVQAATIRPAKLGRPFTHWSIRKLADYLADNPIRRVKVGRERLRQILHRRGISFQRTFQRTRTWKESRDPDKDAKLDRIEEVTSRFPDRCFAFDQFGPLSIRPCHGTCWARRKHPDRLPATDHRTHGIRYFHGCYSLGDDQLWGVVRRRKSGDHTLAALQVDPRRPPGRRPDLRDPGQPVGQQDPGHPGLDRPPQGEAVLHPDQRLVGQPDRGPVRAAAHLRDGQFRPRKPPRSGPPPARIPALAQRQRPPPRRLGRATPRTRPHPQ
jgi:transposase